MGSSVLWRIGAIALAAAALAACGKETQPRVPERPGVPAYWESDVPREPPRPPPGTRFETWPLLDGPPKADRDGTPDEARGGTSDRFLWEGGPQPQTQPAQPASDAQKPLRMLDDEGEDEAPETTGSTTR